jgi:hypothetical protein
VHLFTGTGTRRYADYVDVATGQMLTAKPGGQYDIRATWDVLPVPPADGYWEEVVTTPEAVEAEAEAVATEAPKAKRGTPTIRA